MTDYTLEQIRSVFGDGAMTASGKDRRLAAFDRAIAQHDAELREQVAREIRAEVNHIALTTVLSHDQAHDLLGFAARLAEQAPALDGRESSA